MKDQADDRTCELTLDQVEDFVRRARAAQRAIDELITEPAVSSDARGAWTCSLCGFRGFWSGGAWISANRK